MNILHIQKLIGIYIFWKTVGSSLWQGAIVIYSVFHGTLNAAMSGHWKNNTLIINKRLQVNAHMLMCKCICIYWYTHTCILGIFWFAYFWAVLYFAPLYISGAGLGGCIGSVQSLHALMSEVSIIMSHDTLKGAVCFQT